MSGKTLLAAALVLAGLAGGGAPSRAQDADTAVDRALQKVEALLSTLRANPKSDAALVKWLEDLAADLRAAKGVKDPGDGGSAPPPLPTGVDEAIYRITLDTFLQGLDLKEEAKAAADRVLREFVADYALAKKHEDDKSKGVVRDHTERRIGQTFAPRDANRLKDNLDTIIKRWEWSGGRRGK